LLVAFGSSHAAGYFGASVGKTSPDEDGFDDSNGYKITLGYNANSNIAIEGSYTNLGEFDADDDLLAGLEFFTGVALEDASVEVDGIELAVVASAPLSDSASIFGRIGIFMWDADFTIDTVSFGSISDSDDGSDPFFGAGVSFGVSQTVTLNVEYVAYEASDGDIDYLGAGLAVSF
jgi:opacity protein-like surface antigen